MKKILFLLVIPFLSFSQSDICISATVSHGVCNVPTSFGSINVTVDGGSGNYSYMWYLSGSTYSSSEDLYNLMNNGIYEYSLIVTDNMGGCSASASFEICNPCDFTCSNYDLFNCENCSANILELSKTKHLVKTIDILGRETNNNEGFQLHIYDDGSVEKKYLIK